MGDIFNEPTWCINTVSDLVNPASLDLLLGKSQQMSSGCRGMQRYFGLMKNKLFDAKTGALTRWNLWKKKLRNRSDLILKATLGSNSRVSHEPDRIHENTEGVPTRLGDSLDHPEKPDWHISEAKSGNVEPWCVTAVGAGLTSLWSIHHEWNYAGPRIIFKQSAASGVFH